MKIRVYKNAAGKFLLLVTDKSVAVGVSAQLDTEALADALANDFATNKTVTITPDGNFFVPKYDSAAGTIQFIKSQSQAEADAFKALVEGGTHKVFKGLHEDFDAAIAASSQRIINKAAAAIRRFKKGVTYMDNLVYGLVKCTLTYVPTNETADITADTDETAFAGVVATNSAPVAP
jgi:hypothetical protein